MSNDHFVEENLHFQEIFTTVSVLLFHLFRGSCNFFDCDTESHARDCEAVPIDGSECCSPWLS